MGVYTTKRGLYKPDIGELNWGDKVNANFDILDVHTHDASEITSGKISVELLPELPRSLIYDLFTQPFWGYIPDKPFAEVGSEFSVVNNVLTVNAIDFAKITNRKSSLVEFDKIVEIEEP